MKRASSVARKVALRLYDVGRLCRDHRDRRYELDGLVGRNEVKRRQSIVRCQLAHESRDQSHAEAPTEPPVVGALKFLILEISCLDKVHRVSEARLPCGPNRVHCHIHPDLDILQLWKIWHHDVRMNVHHAAIANLLAHIRRLSREHCRQLLRVCTHHTRKWPIHRRFLLPRTIKYQPRVVLISKDPVWQRDDTLQPSLRPHEPYLFTPPALHIPCLRVLLRQLALALLLRQNHKFSSASFSLRYTLHKLVEFVLPLILQDPPRPCQLSFQTRCTSSLSLHSSSVSTSPANTQRPLSCYSYSTLLFICFAFIPCSISPSLNALFDILSPTIGILSPHSSSGSHSNSTHNAAMGSIRCPPVALSPHPPHCRFPICFVSSTQSSSSDETASLSLS